MQLYIDASGGIAGDMFTAALISAGADKSFVLKAMQIAALKLGYADIKLTSAKDDATRLNIGFQFNEKHIKGEKARELLNDIFDELNIQDIYRKFGFKVLDILIDAEKKAHSEFHFSNDKFYIYPIGTAHTPYKNEAPNRPDELSNGKFYINIFPEYESGLKDLDKFTHLFVFAYFDRSHGYSLVVNPPHNNREVGLFASRSPFRPNPIGMDIVKILKIEKNIIHTSPMDFFDNTPVIDLKPVINSLDHIEDSNNGWLTPKDHDVRIVQSVEHIGHKHMPHENNHSHSHEDAFLHEAQDILIDITGAVTAMQNLNIFPEAFLISPVSVGDGMVHFSHGKVSVPAPATKIILEKYSIPYNKGPINNELCTPTGAAILAALNSKLSDMPLNYSKCGKSRGTKDLDIEPLKIYF
jgi:tRNA-Thr(GGU) m(6)t(6)A37 methyltransferase TsaA